MTRALVAVTVVLSACSFGDALRLCVAAGRCPDDGGGGSGGASGGGSGGGVGGGTAGGAAVGAPARYCTDAGICWEHPLPAGSSLTATWVHNQTDGWAAGARGLVLHYDGTTLSVDAPATPTAGLDDFSGLWGTSNGDVYVVGNGAHALYRHSAAGWAPVSIGGSQTRHLDYPIIAGNEDAGVLFVVSEYGVVRGPLGGPYGFDPLAAPGEPTSAAGASTGGVFVTFIPDNPGPSLYFVDAGSAAVGFEPVDVPGAGPLFGVIRHSDGNLWVVGEKPDPDYSTFAAQQTDGGWLDLDLQCENGVAANSVSQAEEGDVLLACGLGDIGLASPGSAAVASDRSPLPRDPGLYSVSALGSFALAGGVGELTTRSGAQQWSTLLTTDNRVLLHAAVGAGTVAAVGTDQLILVRDGGEWLVVDPQDMDENNLTGVGFVDGALVVSGDSTLYRSTGTGFASARCPVPSDDQLVDLAAVGDEVWVASADGGIFHSGSAGDCVAEVFTGAALAALAATSPSRVWAVGPAGNVWARDGVDGGWQRHAVAAGDFTDVALTATEVWGVTTDGLVSRLSPGPPTVFGPDGTCRNTLAAVDAADGGVVLFAAGDADPSAPHLCIYSAAGSRVLEVPSDNGVNALAADSSTVWMFGFSSSVLRYPPP